MTSSSPRRTQGALVAEWLAEYLVHGDGDKYGRPFQLHPFQLDFIEQLYRTDRNGKRIVKRAVLGLPKGSGKTELAAALAIAELAGPFAPESPNVIIAAASFEQADLCFGTARTMITEGKLAPYLEAFDTEIMRRDGRPGIMRRVAAAAGTNDGHRPTFLVCDEVHEWTGAKERVHLILSSGLAKRSDALELSISTAGFDKETLLGRLFDYGQRVNAGDIDDPSFLFVWRSASEQHDLNDPKQLRAAIAEANPAVQAGFMDGERLAARYSEIPTHEFERYHLNRFVTSAGSWLPAGAWAACEDKSARLDRKLPATVGIDFAWKHDTTAVVVAQRQGPRIVLRARIFDNPHLPGTHAHTDWAFDSGELKDYLRRLFEEFPVAQAVKPDDPRQRGAPGPYFVADPYQLREEIKELTDAGLNIASVDMRDMFMVPATRSLFDAIVVDKVIAHDGDPAFAAQVEAAVPKWSARGGYRLDKASRSSGRPIDAAEAASLAVHSMPAAPPKPYVRKPPRIPVGF